MTMDDRFYSDGTTRITRYTLHKKGFVDIRIRKIHGIWQMLVHTNSRMDERWATINMSEEIIQENIRLYAVE